LISAIAAANPNTIVVLNTGNPVAMPWKDQVRAILEMWFPGQEGGWATADLLTGSADPAGRLPMTFPQRGIDTPALAPGHPERSIGIDGIITYSEGIFVGYRHYDRSNVAPQFAFGHGLTYGRFAYADLDAPSVARIGEAVTVSLLLTNTGERTAKETVQIYVGPNAPAPSRPLKELKAFAKVELAPGERRTITLTLAPRDFAAYDPEREAWVAEPGAYDLIVAASAADVRLTGTITLAPA